MGKARFVVILGARWRWRWRTELKIPPPVSTTSTRASTRRRRDKTRRIDGENYFQSTRVFPPLDRSPDGAFRPRRSSAKRVREEEEEKASREMQRRRVGARTDRSPHRRRGCPWIKKTYLQLGDVPSSTSPPCSPCADVDLNIASGSRPSTPLLETEINQPDSSVVPRRRRRRRREQGFNTKTNDRNSFR